MAATPGATGSSSPADPSASTSTAPSDAQPDRPLLAETSGSPFKGPTGFAFGNPLAAAAIGGPSSLSPSPSADGTLPEFNPANTVDAPNPNPNPNRAKGKDTPSSREEQTASRTYAAIAADKARRPPPAFVTNLNAFHPVKRGNAIVLKMPEDLYQQRLSAFTHALIGRIYLPKNSPPRALPDLKSELQTLFNTSLDWKLNPLGKGFFSLKFANQEDRFLASRFTSWRLKVGSFHIREWKPNFDPYKEQNSFTQIWVRLFHLPEEYWDADFLVGIFRAVGNVVKLDGSTVTGSVGHFARALVEIDLNYPLADSVTIECGGSSFLVDFGFENMPLFCSHCRFIGHLVSDCKSRKREEGAKENSDKPPENPKQKAPKHVDKPAEAAPTQDATKKTARQLQQDVPSDKPSAPKQKAYQLRQQPSAPVSTSNAFTALENDTSSDPHTDVIRELVPQMTETHDNPDEANPVRELVPLSEEVAAALHSIAGRDYTLHNPETENVLSSDEEEEEIQADNPSAVVAGSQITTTDNAEGLELETTRTPPSPMAAAGRQADNTSSELNAREPESSPKGSAMPSKTISTDTDETTTVVPSPDQIAGHKMSAAAKRRAKEALRKNRVRSSMKTRSRFDTSSDTLHVLPDRRGKSVQVPAASVGLPHGATQSQLDDKIRAAMEQGKCPKAYVVDTGQPVKAMGFIANQRWGDVLDLAVSDKDFYDLMS